MNNPGGGKNDIPNRLKRQFFLVNMPPPDDEVVNDIYGHMTAIKWPKNKIFKDDKATEENINNLCKATIRIWNNVKEKFIPTPMKFTYNFTMKDISKIMLGIFRIDNDLLKKSKTIQGIVTKDIVVHLWRNEVTRVLSDRFIDLADLDKFKGLLDSVSADFFKETEEIDKKVLFNEFLQEDTEDE